MTDDWKSTVDSRLRKIETAIEVDKVIGAGISTRLDKIEGTLAWLVKLLIGAIILAMVSFVVGGGIAPR